MALTTTINPQGLVNRTPAEIRDALIAQLTLANPNYTGTLPASLVENLLSTSVAGILQMEQARAEAVASLLPSTANDALMVELGALLGVAQSTGEPLGDYRARLKAAFSYQSMGHIAYLKTQLNAVPNVSPRLVSVTITSNGTKVLCGGEVADPNPQSVATAIFNSLLNCPALIGTTPTSGGTSVTATITDGADAYQITYVKPTAKALGINISYATNSPNYIPNSAIVALAQGKIVDYVNSLHVGAALSQAQLASVFTNAVADYIQGYQITILNFTYTVDGVAAQLFTGTVIVPSYQECYWTTTADSIQITAAQ